MKSKYLVLLTMCAAFCLLGCSCKGDDPQDSLNSSIGDSSSASTESVYEETDAVLSVNQKAVTIGVGESYTLVADVEGIDNPQLKWEIDGDYDNGTVTLVQDGNTAVITGAKVGQTKLIVSVKNGGTYMETVDVTVKEDSGVRLVLGDNIGFNDNGYYTRLSTLSTDNGDVTSIISAVSAYKDNAIVPTSGFTWESLDKEVVTTDGNKFISGKEGKTTVVGSCTIEGSVYTVEVAVEVYRPKIALDESFVVEVENLSPLTLQSSTSVKGLARDVVYDGQSVGEYNAQSGVVTLFKSALPKTAAKMGEDRTLTIETDKASYLLNVDLYTKIIHNKEEFDGFATLAKNACSMDAALWDGYFVLGSDIAYNGQFHSKIADIDSLWAAVGGDWSNGGLYGFKGVFDGKGHKIEGIRIDNGANIGSIFGVLHIDGVIKNISFTHASVAANSSLVCGAGGGTVENIYVQYDSIGKGTQHYESDKSINTHCATFFGFKEPTLTANVTNCVIDVTKADCNPNVSVMAVGNQYVAIKNAFVIGGTEELRKASNATLSFPLVIDFVEDVNAQNRYRRFDGEFWSLEKGVPVSNAVYEEIHNQDVQFTEQISHFVAGTSYQFSVNNSYVSITSNSENVAIKSGVATALASAENGEEIVITATSLFDETKKDSFSCVLTVADPANVEDLTAEGNVFYDITEGKVYFAELAAKVPTDKVLYFINTDYSAISYTKDGEAAKEIMAVTQDKMYKLTCLSVTKVLSKAEDLHYLRRDYTVVSEGNKGCYDGKIIGTFVLVNDIDCTGLTFKNAGSYWENSRGFGGTLDGRGYKIDNLIVTDGGLFGAMAYATIKNVSFTNVRLQTSVALFANRMYNTVLENVTVEYVEYVTGSNIYGHSGLIFHDLAFDCTLKNVTLDISKLSGVKFLTECLYDEKAPNAQSKEKSVYENVTVIVESFDNIPAFAYNSDGTAVAYPKGCFKFKVGEVTKTPEEIFADK